MYFNDQQASLCVFRSSRVLHRQAHCLCVCLLSNLVCPHQEQTDGYTAKRMKKKEEL